jgi:hypothetical protein
MRFSIPRSGVPAIEGASWIRAEGVRVAGQEVPPVLIRLGVGDDGRLIATGILIEAAGELTTRALRLPLAGIVAEFAAVQSKPATHKRLIAELRGRTDLDEDPRWRDWQPDSPNDLLAGLAADFVDVAARTRPAQRARPGRHGHPDEHYRRIARAYLIAKRKYPKNPIRKLMEATGAPEATVHRWIKTAREKGFIKTQKED